MAPTMISNSISLVFNLAFLVAMSTLASLIQQREAKAWGEIARGLLFGVSVIIGMIHPLVLGPGLIFDGRSVMLSLCGLFFGPLSVGIASGMAIGYRLFAIGGPGVLMGVLVIASSTVLGLMGHRRWSRRTEALSTGTLLAFGLLVHVVMVLLMFTLPGDTGIRVMKQIGITVLLVYPLATLLIGKVLSSQEAQARSIATLRESREALSKGRAQLQTLIDTIPDLIWIKDVEGVYLDCNRRFERFFGTNKANIVGKDDYDFLEPEHAVFFREKDRLAILAGGATANEERITFADDGHEEYLETIKTPIVGIDGKFMGVLGIGRDITKRKQAEESLREAYQFNKQILHSAQEGIIVYGPDLHYQVWNQYMEKLSGVSACDLLGRHPLKVFPVLRGTEYFERIARALTGMEFVPKDHSIHFSISGKSCWVSDSTAPLRNTKNEIIGVIQTIRDVTQRKQVDEALKESEYFFRESQRAAAIGSYKADFTKGVWESSLILNELWGIDENYTRTIQGWLELIHPEDQAMMARYLREEVIAGRSPFSKEYRIIRRSDGETRWMFGLGKVVFDDAGTPLFLIGTILDITKRKQSEAEKARLEAQLQHAQKMKGLGILVAGVAHNFNNIMAIIMCNAALREESATDPLDIKAYGTIGKACRRAGEVVKSLMQFARPTVSNRAPFELHALVREVCLLLENTIRNRVKIVVEFTQAPLWIAGDAGTINHVLVNLCINAIDAMQKGGTLTLRTAIHEEAWVELFVEDTGEGMTPEVLAHVLEPFFTTKDVGKGTGLGLSISYGVIKAHGGEMDITSQPGQGTTVKIRLPRIPAPVG